VIYFASAQEMFSNSSDGFKFDTVGLKTDGWTFDVRKSDPGSFSNPYLALTARTGDLNLVTTKN